MVRLEFLSQMADVHVDRAVEGCRLAVVKALHELVPRNDSTGGAHQHFQNVEFESGHLDSLSILEDLAAPRIENDAIDLQAPRIGWGFRLDTPQDGPDARGQL